MAKSPSSSAASHPLKLDTVGGTTSSSAPAPNMPPTDTTTSAPSASASSAAEMDARMERVRAKIAADAAAMSSADSASALNASNAQENAHAHAQSQSLSPSHKTTTKDSDKHAQHPSLATEALEDAYDEREFDRRSHSKRHRLMEFFGLDCCLPSLSRGRGMSEPTHITSVTMNVKDDLFGLDRDGNDDMSSIFSGWSEGKDTIVSQINNANGNNDQDNDNANARAKERMRARARRPQEFLFFCGTERLEQFQPKEASSVPEQDHTLQELDVRTLHSSVEKRELPMFFSPSTPRILAAVTPRTSLLMSRTFSFPSAGEIELNDDLDYMDGNARVKEHAEEGEA